MTLNTLKCKHLTPLHLKGLMSRVKVPMKIRRLWIHFKVKTFCISVPSAVQVYTIMCYINSHFYITLTLHKNMKCYTLYTKLAIASHCEQQAKLTL